MLTKRSVNCLPTPAWLIVTFLADQVLAGDAMAVDTFRSQRRWWRSRR
jgi:hypothetical protein